MAILAANIGFKVSFGGLQLRVMSAPSPRNRAVFCLKGKDYSSSVPVRYIPKKSLKPKEPENDSFNSSALKGASSLVPVRHKTKESLKFNEEQNSRPFNDLRKTKSHDSLDSAAFKGGDYSSSLPVSYTAEKSLKANETENSQSLKDSSKSDGCDIMGLGAFKSNDFHVPVRLTPLEANEPENTLPFKGLSLKKTESCDNLDSSSSVSMDNSSSISVRRTSPKKPLEADAPQNSLPLKDSMKVESFNNLSLSTLEGANSSSVPARHILNKSLEANEQENLQPVKDMGKKEFCDSLYSNQLKDKDYSSSIPIRQTTKKSLKANEAENSPPLKALRKNESHNCLDLSALGIKVMNNGPGIARSITFLERSHIQNGACKNNVPHDKQVLEEEIVDDIAVMGNEIMEELEEIDQEIMMNQGMDTLEENVLQAGKITQDVENLAVKLLASRAFTAFELRKKLKEQRFPPNIIEAVVKNFQSRGLINDGLYAEAFSRSRWSSSSWGPRRIKQALSKKGINEGDAEKAVRLVFEDGKSSGDQESNIGMSKLSMDHLLIQASKQWLRVQDVPKEKRKSRIIRWLQYRGFNWGVIGFILKKLESQYPP